MSKSKIKAAPAAKAAKAATPVIPAAKAAPVAARKAAPKAAPVVDLIGKAPKAPAAPAAPAPKARAPRYADDQKIKVVGKGHFAAESDAARLLAIAAKCRTIGDYKAARVKNGFHEGLGGYMPGFIKRGLVVLA